MYTESKHRHIGKVCCFLVSLALAIGGASDAHAGTAAVVASACKLKPKTAQQDQFRFMGCSNLISGYLEGYRSGAHRGLTVAFLDAKNLATVENQQELKTRIDRLLRKAECVPPAAKVDQIEVVYVNYFNSRPELKTADFGEVLSEALEDYFCPLR